MSDLPEQGAEAQAPTETPTFDAAVDAAVSQVMEEQEAPLEAAEADTGTEETDEAPAVDPALQMSWDRIEAREKAIMQRTQDHGTLQKQVEKMQALQEKQVDMDSLKQQNKLEWLKAHGVNAEDIIDSVLKDGKEGPDDVKKYADTKNQELAQRIEQLEQQIVVKEQENFVSSLYNRMHNDERYQWMKEYEEENPVVNLGQIAMNYHQQEASNGVQLTIDQVLDTINLGLDKIRLRYKSIPEETTKVEKSTTSKPVPANRQPTITNRDAADSAPTPADLNKMSFDEKMEHMLKGM